MLVVMTCSESKAWRFSLTSAILFAMESDTSTTTHTCSTGSSPKSVLVPRFSHFSRSLYSAMQVDIFRSYSLCEHDYIGVLQDRFTYSDKVRYKDVDK